MLQLLLLLSSIAWGQEAPANLDQRLKNLELEIAELRSGRPSVNGLTTFLSGIKFADGTVLTSSGTTTTLRSTFTYVNGGSTNATVFRIAYATVTYVSDGISDTMIALSGSGNPGAANQEICWSFLVNGGYPTGFTSSSAVRCQFGGSTQDQAMTGFNVRVLPAGTHSLALTIVGTGGATVTWPAAYDAAAVNRLQFGAFPLK